MTCCKSSRRERIGAAHFTQTFEAQPSPLLEVVKPLLRWVTTIDFGSVTYEDDFRCALEAGGFEIEEREVLEGHRRRSALLLVVRPQR